MSYCNQKPFIMALKISEQIAQSVRDKENQIKDLEQIIGVDRFGPHNQKRRLYKVFLLSERKLKYRLDAGSKAQYFDDIEIAITAFTKDCNY